MNTTVKLLLLALIWLGATNVNAQLFTNGKASFEGYGKNKILALDTLRYRAISPSLFVYKGDTIQKLQSPVPLADPVVLDGYLFLGRLKEGLSFKKAECTSWQWVDIYRRKKMVKKDAPQAKVEERIVHDTIEIRDSFFIDTGSVKYVGPIDTGLLIVKAQTGFAKRSPIAFTVGALAQIANGKTDPRDSSVLVNNFRHEVGVEGGIYRSVKQFNLDCDTCYGWGPQQMAFQAWMDMFWRTKFGAKKRHEKNSFNIFVFAEARYRALGNVDELPVTKKISRISLQLGGEVSYGPATLQLGVIETLGRGLGFGANFTWRFLYKEPKKKFAGLRFFSAGK